MGKTAVAIDLTAIDRRELESLASRRRTAQGLAQRARIVLLAAQGAENKDISLRVGAAPNTVEQMAPPICRASPRWPSRRASSRRAAPDRR
jgi:DNA-binding NarL/FixJ family response regulator